MLADLILYCHFLFVLGVILPVPVIILGGWWNWRLVRHFWLRTGHLGMIAFVTAEALLGIDCPLTIWEDGLRRANEEDGYQRGMISDWVSSWLFYDCEPWVFTAIYAGFGVVVLALFYFVPPEKAFRRRSPR
ncbi:MAG TPA: DUF2784 domain-containing protein [bacterium]|nr:DUF2784 domain-containing protein [Candidatus Omnitrophota bacterium]HOJ62083.1 DUF2784 domain-containing protein [bacterium]HOL93870.1 DUF2784 domain-containing protein [bacterium]HPP00451.1 DUF2784 domain-containing protein [bacterium]HXK93461.1 DUF2784 domain-containing protein [bacterium]